MGLEFTSVYNKDLLFSLQDKWLDYFERAYFDPFNEKYDNLIDRYGTFRLEINHLQYLATLLEDDFNKPENAKKFVTFIRGCIKENTVLKVYGD